MLEATVNGVQQLLKDLAAEQERGQKALVSSTKVEGFRLKGLLQKEIRSGDPGGQRFAPLSFIARLRGRTLRKDAPLSRMALAVRYWLKSSNPIDIRIGFTGPQVSKRWQRLAEMHQEGFTTTPSDQQRAAFASRGERLSERSSYRKYLFLKDSTQQMKTPARPIIEPFWARHEGEAAGNIKANWKRKMRGERI